MKLTATKVDKAKPRDKAFKLSDGDGMFLLVSPKGGRAWRLKYRIHGKEKQLALGTYPDVSLKLARERRADARKAIAAGIDPSAQKQAEKRAQNAADTFEAVAREWIDARSGEWGKSNRHQVTRRLERDAFPWIGTTKVHELEPPEVLRMLRRTESRGAIETAHRVKQLVGQVMRFAVATGRAQRDPTADLAGALKTKRAQHHASITNPAEIGPLLRVIDSYEGQFVTRCALQLAPLVFVRPGELRKAEWVEFDLDAAEWRIPAERMKMNAPHIVPLSVQAVAVLRELEPLTGRGRYVFPGARSADRPMSENTLNAALRRLGYDKDQLTAHGLRSMASTLLNEQGWNRDAIERQLAHAERDNVRAAYNYAEHLDERRRMMQVWADYLAGLKRGANVTPIESASDV
ncbi:integrase arm-type DNA-binding domain-containing protein [uncultured Salinisphaera sp.]|uniref:tyrosine-type recombinase/integrase n=1 Tax=uncultured Salinisphaera sp. TaxID=359372 RepID=UPI0032B1ABC2